MPQSVVTARKIGQNKIKQVGISGEAKKCEVELQKIDRELSALYESQVSYRNRLEWVKRGQLARRVGGNAVAEYDAQLKERELVELQG